jgi:plastocyanin
MRHDGAVLAACLAVFGLAAGGAAAAGSATAAGQAVVVHVTAGLPSESQFKVAPRTVPHGKVLFEVVNKGHKAHGFSINGVSTKVLKPRATATITVVFKRKGRYTYQCVTTTPPPDFGEGYNDVPADCGGGVITVR